MRYLWPQGSGHTEVFDAKHESQLMYEGETLSYDPAIYGGAFEARARIKTLKVCAGAPPCTPGMALEPLTHLITRKTGKRQGVWGLGISVLGRNP